MRVEGEKLLIRFVIGKSTVSKIVRCVTQAISKYVGNKYIKLLTLETEVEEWYQNFT